MPPSTDRPPDPDHPATDRPGLGSRHETTTSTPRWVKIFGIIALALLVVLVVVGLLTGGHGPGRHTTGLGGPAAPATVAALRA